MFLEEHCPTTPTCLQKFVKVFWSHVTVDAGRYSIDKAGEKDHTRRAKQFWLFEFLHLILTAVVQQYELIVFVVHVLHGRSCSYCMEV